MVMSLAGDQRVVGHRWNETRQLDFEAFIFKKSSMHSDKKRQIAHRVSGQDELDYLGAENVIDRLQKINRESNDDNHEITRKTKSHTFEPPTNWKRISQFVIPRSKATRNLARSSDAKRYRVIQGVHLEPVKQTSMEHASPIDHNGLPGHEVAV